MTPRFTRRLKVGASLGAAMGLALLPALPAAAAETYPPKLPTAASGVCVGDIPYFSYQVDFGEGGKFVGLPMTITFVNPSGANSVINTVVPAPTASAVVLWPGAAEEPNPDWPGWELDASGNWVETSTDEGAFTRAPGGVTVEFSVNPTLSTSTTYPPASAICANPPQSTPEGEVVPAVDTETAETAVDTAAVASGDALADTGADVTLAAAAALGLVVVGGGALLIARRRS